jgi:hypothetical protein
MEIPEIKKIKLGDKAWFFVQPNKIVIGTKFLHKDNHLTISFGNKSGYLDLHMTKNREEDEKKHLTILKIAHVNISYLLKYINVFAYEILKHELHPFESYWLAQNDARILPLQNDGIDIDKSFDDHITNQIIGLRKGKKIIIDETTTEFYEMVSNLKGPFKKLFTDNYIDSSSFDSLGAGYGIVILRDDVKIYFRVAVKNEFKNFHFDFGDIKIEKVLRAVFGEHYYERIMKNIKLADNLLSNNEDRGHEFDTIVIGTI